MLSHNIASKQGKKDEIQSMGGGGGDDRTGGGRNTSSLRPPEQIHKCPRCDSSNTKFCYYNNYNLAQPRHFCKACRRYWTKGGALRNVPIGGSCSRKNKKKKSCSSRYFSEESSSKFLGLSTLDFHLGELNFPPRVTANQFTSSYGIMSSNHSLVSHDPLGYNLPISSSQIIMKQGNNNNHHHQQQQQNQDGVGLGSFHEMGTNNEDLHHNTNLASSIESLSSINQDLHWKLQQQRLSMFFGGHGENHQQHQKEQAVLEPHHQKLQPILFQNLETSKSETSMDGDSRKQTTGDCNLATEWFFDNSYAPDQNLNPPTSTNGNGAMNDQNGSMNNWNGIQAWNHMNHFSS